MTDHLKIAGYSAVYKNTVSKNGKPIFEAAGEMQPGDFLLAAYQQLDIGYSKFHKMDNLCKMGLIATEVLLAGEKKYEDPFATAIVLSNANASLDADIKYYDSVANIASPALFVYTLPNIVIGEISIKHSFKGENAFFIFDAFNAGFLVQYVSNLFYTTGIEQCICGWADFLKDEYEAVLFLVKKGQAAEDEASFTATTLNNIYQQSTWKKQH